MTNHKLIKCGKIKNQEWSYPKSGKAFTHYIMLVEIRGDNMLFMSHYFIHITGQKDNSGIHLVHFCLPPTPTYSRPRPGDDVSMAKYLEFEFYQYIIRLSSSHQIVTRYGLFSSSTLPSRTKSWKFCRWLLRFFMTCSYIKINRIPNIKLRDNNNWLIN